MPDSYADLANGLTGPLLRGFAITPSDTVDLPEITRQVRITGVGGVLAVVWPDGSETTEPVSAGDSFDWRLRRVRATGTTATGIRGYV